MEAITKFLKAVFNFIVGDWIILGGVTATLLLTWLLSLAMHEAALVVLLIGLAATLIATLRRETQA